MQKYNILDIYKRISNNKTKQENRAEHKALCILHSEITPSLSLNTKKNSFYCFGCFKGGNSEELIKEYYNISIQEVYKWLEKEGFKEPTEYKKNNNSISNNNMGIGDYLKVENEDIKRILNKCEYIKEPTEYILSRSIKQINYSIQDCFFKLKESTSFNGVVVDANSLIIPIYDNLKDYNIVSLQLVTAENKKMFLRNTTTEGLLKVYGNPNNTSAIYIVEGFIDALSIASLGFNAICVFNKGNILKAVYNIKNREELQNKGIPFNDLNLLNDKAEHDIGRESSRILNTYYVFSNIKECKDANDLLKRSETALREVLNFKAFKEDKKAQSFYKQLREQHIKDIIKTLQKQKILQVFKEERNNTYYYCYKNEGLITCENFKHLAENIKNKLETEQDKNIRIPNYDNKNYMIRFIENCIDMELIYKIEYNPAQKANSIYIDKNTNRKIFNKYKKSGIHQDITKLDNNKAVFNYSNIDKVLLNLVDFDLKGLEFIKKLLAWQYKYPHIKTSNILVLSGVQGSGKSTYANILSALFGDNCNSNLNISQLLNEFNSAIFNKTQLIIQEANTGELKSNKANSLLKNISGDKELTINKKFKDTEDTQLNYANITILANKKDILNIESDDRRYTIFYSTQSMKDRYTETESNIIMGNINNNEVFDLEIKEFARDLIKIGAELQATQLIKPYENETKRSLQDITDINNNEVMQAVGDISNNYIREFDTMNKLNNLKDIYFMVDDNVIYDNKGYILRVDNDGFLRVSNQIFKKYLEFKGIKTSYNKAITQAKQSNLFMYDNGFNDRKKGRYIKIKIIADTETADTETEDNNSTSNINSVKSDIIIKQDNQIKTVIKQNADNSALEYIDKLENANIKENEITIKNNEIANKLISNVKNADIGINLEYKYTSDIKKELKYCNENNIVICNSFIWNIENLIDSIRDNIPF